MSVADEKTFLERNISSRVGSYDDSNLLQDMIEEIKIPNFGNAASEDKVKIQVKPTLESFYTEPEHLSDPPSIQNSQIESEALRRVSGIARSHSNTRL